jgi:hypothetical protein
VVGVFFLEGLVTAPSVIRAAVGHGRHRRVRPPRPTGPDGQSDYPV